MEKNNQQSLKTQNIIDIIITVSLYEAWRPFRVSRDIPAPHQGRHRIPYKSGIRTRMSIFNSYILFIGVPYFLGKHINEHFLTSL